MSSSTPVEPNGAPLQIAGAAFTAALSNLTAAHFDEISRLEGEINLLRQVKQVYHSNGNGTDSSQDVVCANGVLAQPEVEQHRSHSYLQSPPTSQCGSNSNIDLIEASASKRTPSKEYPLTPTQSHRISLRDEDKQRRQLALESVAIVDDLEDEGNNTAIARVVNSSGFEMFFGVIILTNAIFMGGQVEYESQDPGADTPTAFHTFRYIFTAAASIEILMRILAVGPVEFLWSKRQWGWNYLDIVVVVSSWIEVIMDIVVVFSRDEGDGEESQSTGVNISNIRVVRILRVARLARVLRIGQMFRIIRAFRVLVFSIQTTLKTVVWALLLLFTIIYVFGLVLVQAITEYLAVTENDNPDLYIYWGSLPRTMFTLFKSISGGLSWHDCVVPLSDVHGICVAIFVFYITLTSLAVLNIITGVFCESAMEAAQNDRELAVQKHMTKRKEYVAKVRELFKDIDTDNSNIITLDEFERHFDDEKSHAFFASLDIESDLAWDLFKLIDTDEGGSLDIHEFVTGCLRLRGNAKSLDVAKLTRISLRADDILTQVIHDVQQLTCISVELQQQVNCGRLQMCANVSPSQEVQPDSPYFTIHSRSAASTCSESWHHPHNLTKATTPISSPRRNDILGTNVANSQPMPDMRQDMPVPIDCISDTSRNTSGEKI